MLQAQISIKDKADIREGDSPLHESVGWDKVNFLLRMWSNLPINTQVYCFRLQTVHYGTEIL